MPINPTSDTDSLSFQRTSPAGSIKCPHCEKLNRLNAERCAFCGQSLDQRGVTRILNVADIPQSPDLPSTSEPPPSGDTITFQMGDRYLTLPLQESIIFGRCTLGGEDPRPDVDLTSLRAQEQGVSRRHLRIKYTGTALVAIDLGSSNGTWLNGHRMSSYTEYPIGSGDELRLGLFKLKVKF